ncbi:MAG: N-acetylmuramoyl-L-alanine amidase [Elusimicrobiaceae bacterium]|nr:N-acetylmuramoyl-L-alanine amidase [Elusimicrobiaceae bacterium]
MKRVLRTVCLSLLSLFLAQLACGQDQVPLLISGKKQGSVSALTKNGTTYVDLQKTARKLGASVELFARSKQVKITARGFYAILTASLPEIILNAQTVRMPGAVFSESSTIYVPVEFFLLPQFGKAVGKEISFVNGALEVERPFDFARIDTLIGSKQDQLVFASRKKITWTTSSPNPHTVVVTFPDVTVKRDEHFRLKTDFIASVSITQARADAVMRVVLGKKATSWNVEEENGKIYFRAGEALSSAPAPKAEVAQSAPVPAPESKDDFEEMPAQVPAATSVIKTETPVISAVSQTPVMKAAPQATISEARKKMRIMVDPGHGGKDPGAVRSRAREKELNLAVSKELYKLLQKGGFEVKITRDNDTFIPLSDRSKKANTFKADLFVSIHTNASKNKNANGFEVYFRSEKATDKEAAETAALENEAMQYEEVHYNFVDALLQSLAKNEYINESSKVAGYVRNAVYKQPGIGIAVNQNNSVRQANFYVLKGVQSPAILIEMGYISSQKDRGRLTQSAVQKRMAQGIYDGIRNYAKNEGWIK